MISYQRRKLESTFAKWIEEPVYTSMGIYQTSRKLAFLMFIEDLCAFLKLEGYVFSSKESEMAISFARLIFRIQQNLLSKPALQPNPNDSVEDFDLYCHLYDTQRWEQFYKKWEGMDDFSHNSNPYKIFGMIPIFAWHFIDINASGPTRLVDELNEDSESDGDDRPRIRKDRDPYLDDQANAASKFNRWD